MILTGAWPWGHNTIWMHRPVCRNSNMKGGAVRPGGLPAAKIVIDSDARSAWEKTKVHNTIQPP